MQVLNPLGQPTQLRVGVHAGKASSGLIGGCNPRFNVFGDTMNTASRMESTGEAGRVHVSGIVADALPNVPWEWRCGVTRRCCLTMHECDRPQSCALALRVLKHLDASRYDAE